ncbi:hypothetical protein AVEN_211856-1 [Araneus ventricosus]|uniref:Uncharacterized protein n=1 Tax=Araneus ventricosus TaxID=182803 RepID=A0A4Y1ZNT1_ARAVE|nr:hypothetical protein AVEN_36582-1 [Araneus ventricosus]GBL58269.1 hypothetical protein AVEN_51011-1 [Araneus ventricosus]GBL58307.1 hypothetical protein AVEN_113533-1 [Araneus ventricosus]GBL58321.1 hypothetical protein AVEN_211856-1 [Araneus ventricosus]
MYDQERERALTFKGSSYKRAAPPYQLSSLPAFKQEARLSMKVYQKLLSKFLARLEISPQWGLGAPQTASARALTKMQNTLCIYKAAMA